MKFESMEQFNEFMNRFEGNLEVRTTSDGFGTCYAIKRSLPNGYDEICGLMELLFMPNEDERRRYSMNRWWWLATEQTGEQHRIDDYERRVYAVLLLEQVILEFDLDVWAAIEWFKKISDKI